MSKYTDEDLESLLASGDAVRNEDGSITWTAENIHNKKPGTWLIRPPQAAPLITTETGADMAVLRKAKRRQALEEGFAVGIGASIEEVLTTDEALSVFTAMVAQTAMDTGRKDFARLAKMLFEALEAMPQKRVEIDQRTQTIDMSKSSFNLLESSPAIQRLIDKNNGTD